MNKPKNEPKNELKNEPKSKIIITFFLPTPAANNFTSNPIALIDYLKKDLGVEWMEIKKEVGK